MMTVARAPRTDRPAPVRSLRLAREHHAGYQAAASTGDHQGAGAGEGVDAGVGRDAGAHGSEVAGPDPDRDPLAILATVVDNVVGVDLDASTDEQVSARLGEIQHAIHRLGSVRDRAAGMLESRALRAARPGGENHALKECRDQLRTQQRMTPAEAKRAGVNGRRLAQHPDAQQASAAGDLPPTHAKLLLETLRALIASPLQDQDHAEAQLLAAAKVEDAATFGRTCRQLLAELDTDAAQAAQDRRNERRELKVVAGADGTTHVHGRGSGWNAEVLHTALHAFRRPDAPDEPERTPGQRTWDALIAVCTTALDAGTSSANRKVRPHVTVNLDHDTIITGTGTAQGHWTGPLPYDEIRRRLADTGVSRLLTDPRGLPIEAGESVRTVPVGLYKALAVRDGGCIADGCDIPIDWCQIMHLEVPYRLHGQLSPATAAPGCTYHHTKLDRDHWTVTWIHGRPILHHPDQPPSHESPPRAGPSGGGPPRGRPPGERPARERPPGDGPSGERPPGTRPPATGTPGDRPQGEEPPVGPTGSAPPRTRTSTGRDPRAR